MVAIADYERELVTRLIDGLDGDRGRDDPRHHRSGRGSPPASRPSRSRSTASTRGPPPRPWRATGSTPGTATSTRPGLIERLGKAETGGVLRLGLVHYNTAAEVDRTLEAVARIAAVR